ncbi:hypothetical protein ACFTWD_01090 [Streptomyces sp. NPDC056943]|uniref:hypothetical protein n=1 Tax=Streptomyces sp. NPDC056943 TaxID=3345971 RepID=UPI00362A43DE
MDRDVEALERRIRRLRELQTKHQGNQTSQFERVSEAVDKVWRTGIQPTDVRLRPTFLLGPAAADWQPPASQLLNPRGIGLRFYLLALFEAQCRLGPGAVWSGDRAFHGELGWGELVAIDVGYSSVTGTYTRGTKQSRKNSVIRQVKSALCTLEGLGDQALVDVPRKKGGHRDYKAFALMNEEGRGDALTPLRYTVPKEERVISVPVDFFLKGWVQVLYPSEILTWLCFRFLRGRFPRAHEESGNYMYAQKRAYMHLLRDSFEDSCVTLRELGLLRRMPTEAEKKVKPGSVEALFLQPTLRGGRADLYEPYRYQLTDEGLAEDALDKTLKELVLRQNGKG